MNYLDKLKSKPWFKPWLTENTIFLTVHGSRCYGTNTPESDTDLKGICIPPKQFYLGLLDTKFEQAEFKVAEKDTEGVIYELRKFLILAANTNPNICEVLFTDPKDHLIVTPLGQRILDNKEKFITTRARFSFGGYARGQLHRIKSHRNWLLNPPKEAPKRSDFGLSDDEHMSVSELGAYKALEDKGVDLSVNAVNVLQKEKAFHNAATQFKQYKNWEKTRNAARAQLEADFGYDTKHGMHLVRLMRMCVEIMEGKGVLVDRTNIDREDLMEVRNGQWTYEKLIEEADSLDAKATELVKTSTLKKDVDQQWLSDFTMELLEEFLFTK